MSARVLGASFDGEDGENLMWVNNSILDGTYWAERPYFWNAGGYRTWIAPEDLFFLDENNEWFVPATLDPAPYRIIEQNDFGATLEADVNLKTNVEKYYVYADTNENPTVPVDTTTNTYSFLTDLQNKKCWYISA